MWGANDNWINVKHSRKFEKDIQNSEVVIYENVGMFPWRKFQKNLLQI